MGALHKAIEAGDREAIRKCAGRRRERDAYDQSGRTPLTLAAHLGDAESICDLIAAGAKKDQRDRLGQTPLIAAAEKGHLDAARALADAGAKLELGDNTGRTALRWAIGRDHADVVRLLMENGVDLRSAYEHGSPIVAACAAGSFKVIELLIQAGYDFRAETLAHPELLFDACQWGRHGIVQMLLEAGMDPNVRLEGDVLPIYKEIPLHMAALGDDTKTVQALLRGGADVDRQDARGATPLWWAQHLRNNKVARVLRAAGGILPTPSPLHQAAERGDARQIRKLVAADPKIDINSTEDGDPLRRGAH